MLGGLGIGFDRFLSLLTWTRNVADVEPHDPRRQRRSTCRASLRPALLQWIVANRLHTTDAVHGSRIGATSLRESALFHAPSV